MRRDKLRRQGPIRFECFTTDDGAPDLMALVEINPEGVAFLSPGLRRYSKTR